MNGSRSLPGRLITCALPVCLWLAIFLVATAQQPPAQQPPGQTTPDPTGQRLKDMLRTADQMEQAGRKIEADAIRQQADAERQALLRRLDALQAEVERIRTAAGATPCIVVSLQVLEVSLSKLQQLGVESAKVSGNDITKSSATERNCNLLLNILNPQGNAANSPSLVDGGQAKQIIEALRKDKLVKVLSEPTLINLSGQPSSFNVGGEVPVLTAQKDGSAAVEFKPYGTHADVTADVIGARTVRLALRLRLAELLNASAVHAGNQTVPGIEIREFSTNIEMQDGQTVVIGCLPQSRLETCNEGLPWISEVPYLGAVLRKTKEVRNEVATVVLVRAEIEQPSAVLAREALKSPAPEAAVPQVVRPAAAPGIAPPITARRPTDGDIWR